MTAEHPVTGAMRIILSPLHWLWCFLLGFIYFACKGMWGIAIVSFFTLNGLFLVLPIMNRSLVRKHYENMGWRVADGWDADVRALLVFIAVGIFLAASYAFFV